MFDLNVIQPVFTGRIDYGYSLALFLNCDLKKRVGNIRRPAVAGLLRSSTVFHLVFTSRHALKMLNISQLQPKT